MSSEWTDPIRSPLAARIAADTGRPLADVTRELNDLGSTPPDEVDPAQVVALLTPTAVALGYPDLAEILARAEQAPPEVRGPALSQLARTLALAVAQAVNAQETRHARP